jgi:hypothetical protein
LAQAAGNDAAYFGRMMDLVRDKIKALGAGTAVSNLDLIITQKSVGDLRNTGQGNLKIIGLMKLYNDTAAALSRDKVAYYDTNGGFKGYEASAEPKFGLISKVNPQGKNTITSYSTISKGEWTAQFLAANKGKKEPSQVIIDREWKKWADDSVRRIF